MKISKNMNNYIQINIVPLKNRKKTTLKNNKLINFI